MIITCCRQIMFNISILLQIATKPVDPVFLQQAFMEWIPQLNMCVAPPKNGPKQPQILFCWHSLSFRNSLTSSLKWTNRENCHKCVLFLSSFPYHCGRVQSFNAPSNKSEYQYRTVLLAICTKHQDEYQYRTISEQFCRPFWKSFETLNRLVLLKGDI